MIGIFVLPTTRDGQQKVDSLILVEVDGTVNDGVADTPNAYAFPDSAKTLSITATPISNEWWQAPVTFDILPDGTLQPRAANGFGAVEVQVMPGTGTYKILKIFVRMLRIHDATADFVKLFDTSATPPLPPAVVPAKQPVSIQNIVKSMNFTTAMIQQVVDHNLSPVDVPRHALTLRPQRPVVLDLVKADAGKLGVVAAPPQIAPQNDTFVVQVSGMSGAAPQTIAVSWPHDVPADKPAPMFVFFRHAPRQESNPEFGKFTRDSMRGYPFNWDYACYGLLENLWYEFPVHLVPVSRGLPYQIEAAGKKVVTVVACPLATPPTGSSQFGRWVEADFVQDILLQIQLLYAASKGKSGAKTLGRVALGAFSSGNYYLGQLLQNGGKTAHPFLTDTVKECYLFSPDNPELQKACLPAVTAWQKGVKSGDGMIRLYNSLVMAEQKQLVPSAGSTTPFFTDSADHRTTVSAVTTPDWMRAFSAASVDPPLKRGWNGMDSHFATSALLLTHAMHRSGF